MIIKPRVRGFICLTAHPEGCEANVREQAAYVQSHGRISDGPKSALVIGASTGYGLASRITAAFGGGAATVGVFFEKGASEKRPATAGWYNSAAFEKLAAEQGLYAGSINGDAFSDEIKERTADLIKKNLGTVDLVVYSLAAPRRTHPKTGEVSKSTLKPIGKVYTGKTLDTDAGIVKQVSVEPAAEDDIRQTVAVMGGEDWQMWMTTLADAGLLATGCRSVAYTYIGTPLTWAIYRDGTIGKAKEDLEQTANRLNVTLKSHDIKAYIAVMKALVTQSSSAIPVVPLYISLLYKVMHEKGGHEGAIEQVQRLFAQQLYKPDGPETDSAGRIRLDDLEMRPEIQNEIVARWDKITTENLDTLTDFAGYKAEFLKLFGFGLDAVDYNKDVEPVVSMEV
jgi:enoyl-[acyl-carrier protein] reductase/trans-2-enoyl-CoA reductase (NAD+)